MNSARDIFGRRLRTFRKLRGLTLEQLGQKAKLGFAHISGIERGVKVPSFEAIDRIAAALKIKPYELFLPDGLASPDADREIKHLVQSITQDADDATKQFVLSTLAYARSIGTD